MESLDLATFAMFAALKRAGVREHLRTFHGTLYTRLSTLARA